MTEAGRAGGVVQGCAPVDPCAAPWARVREEVARTDAMTDIRARNRAISASYARLYQGAPELKWAGTAAFASKQVGCGMDTAESYLDRWPGGGDKAIEDITRGEGVVDPVTLAKYDARETLGVGNLAVYDELYPPLRFYQQNKGHMTNDQIMACMDHKRGSPPVHESTLRGLRQTMNGDGAGGAITMLRHEQRDTLQASVYDRSWMFRRGLNIAKLTGWPSMKLAFSAACETSDPGKNVDFRDYSGQLYNFDARWPFAREAANRFVSLAGNPASAGDISRSLAEIARAAPAP